MPTRLDFGELGTVPVAAGRHRTGHQPARRADHDQCGAAVRVVIAEDNVLLASGLELLLASRGFEVAEATSDGAGFLGRGPAAPARR